MSGYVKKDIPYWKDGHKKKEIDIKCLECGKTFKDTPSAHRKYCSMECKNKNNVSGEQSGSYKHGKSGSKEMIMRKNLRRLHGITLEHKEHMHRSQDGACAICGVLLSLNGKDTHIDHSHATGKIRQLLCSRCNVGLGNFRENIDTLNRAIEYLRRWL